VNRVVNTARHLISLGLFYLENSKAQDLHSVGPRLDL